MQKILIINRSPALSQLLSYILQYGVEVSVVADTRNLEQAASLIASTNPDWIFLLHESASALQTDLHQLLRRFDTLRVIGFAEKEEVVYLLRRKNGTEPAGRPGADIWDRLSLSEFAHLLIEEQKAQEDVRRSQ
jgi:hypothetical protein